MPRSPMKREAGQTVEEMSNQLAETMGQNRLNRTSYPEVSAHVKQEALTRVVNLQRDMLRMHRNRGHRIDLDSLEEVQECADRFMEACAKANVYPTMLAFAAATGWSRPTLYRYIQSHSTESARFLDSLRSVWAAILAEMGLQRQASEAVSIFLLKNSGQGLTDSHELTTLQQGEELFTDRPVTAEEIARRYIIDFDESETN